MKGIGSGFRKIFKEDKFLLAMMSILFVGSLVLILHTFLHFKVGGTTMYIGYSDIGEFSGGEFLSLWNSGGYRTGDWTDIIIFPILGAILGVFHNILAVQIFNRRGKGYAEAFLILSILILVGAFIFLLRLLGEI